MSLAHSHTALVRGAHASPPTPLARIVRVVADGTGRSPEEIWMFGTVAVAVTVVVAAARGLSRLVDLATDVDVWPPPTRRPSK